MRVENIENELQKIKREIRGKNRRIRFLEEKAKSLSRKKPNDKSLAFVLFPEMRLITVMQKNRLTLDDNNPNTALFICGEICKNAYLERMKKTVSN